MIGKREFPSSLFNYLSFANKNYTLTLDVSMNTNTNPARDMLQN